MWIVEGDDDDDDDDDDDAINYILSSGIFKLQIAFLEFVT